MGLSWPRPDRRCGQLLRDDVLIASLASGGSGGGGGAGWIDSSGCAGVRRWRAHRPPEESTSTGSDHRRRRTIAVARWSSAAAGTVDGALAESAGGTVTRRAHPARHPRATTGIAWGTTHTPRCCPPAPILVRTVSLPEWAESPKVFGTAVAVVATGAVPRSRDRRNGVDRRPRAAPRLPDPLSVNAWSLMSAGPSRFDARRYRRWVVVGTGGARRSDARQTQQYRQDEMSMHGRLLFDWGEFRHREGRTAGGQNGHQVETQVLWKPDPLSRTRKGVSWRVS